ncbi:MAG: DNA repair protein RecN [Phocaeicola sp.]|nr:DNA repair protein RecN [Phocaeicola sp.]
MLQSLYIQDYALIDRLDISFEDGFSVITGETGAGKSIILGAIGLLLGQRADTKAIKYGANKCVVEATFCIEGYEMEALFQELDIEYDATECILRREISGTGKSRAFINDSPASLVQMREIGERLIDIHSQHQNLLLNKEHFQLQIIDTLAQNEAILSAYKTLYTSYRETSLSLKKLVETAEENRKDEEYIRFQWEQLDAADLEEGEQEDLEQELETLSHAEEIRTQIYEAHEALDSDEGGVLTSLYACVDALQSISKVYPEAEDWQERADSCLIELKELSRELSNAQDEVSVDPDRQKEVETRLDLIYSLQQKHHVQSVSALIALRDEYAERLENIQSFDERLAQLEAEKQALYTQVKEKATFLHELRKVQAIKVEEQMRELLIPLGMPNVRFEVVLNEKEPDATGMDSVNFLFSANKNTPPQNVASIASGGEIARVMLSLKAMIAGAVKLPTIIFDEIDTGVSGSIAEKMATIMQDMGAQNRQVISITHLPQIAALGKAHYKVYKEDTDTGTNSHIRRLTTEERIKEIANMLSGATLTEAAINNAKALLGEK